MTIRRLCWLFPLLLAGCKPGKDEMLYAMGTYAFLLLGAAILGVIGLHYASKSSWMETVRRWLRRYLPPVCMLGILGSAYPAYLGVQTEGLGRLWLFIAVVIGLIFTGLLQWAQCEVQQKRDLWLKIVTVSASFLVALLFLVNGGKGLL